MKLLNVLPLAALTSAFVLPDEVMLERISNLPVEPKTPSSRWPSSFSKVKSGFRSEYEKATSAVGNTFDTVYSKAQQALNNNDPIQWTDAFDTEIHGLGMGVHYEDEGFNRWNSEDDPDGGHHGDHGDHPDHPKHPDRPHHPKPPHHGKPPHDPHHGHGPPKLTIYQMIQESKYTTKLAELINEHDDIVGLLNNTQLPYNLTVFAPTDEAFNKIPKHHPKPSKEELRQVLLYHVVKDEYPAKRVLFSDTIGTALDEPELGGESGRPQRIRVGLGLKGVTLNFYAGLNAVNIPATNGLIHGLSSILVPPPDAFTLISLMPATFSTSELALERTGLRKDLAGMPHKGLTFFAPDNRAWERLPRIVQAYLFSEKGLKYLRMLMEYHIVLNQSLYSDAYYPDLGEKTEKKHGKEGKKDHDNHRPIHVDLPTLLKDKSLSVDVASYFGIRNIRVNAYTDVKVKNGVARDGVIQVPSTVLIPPKTPGEHDGEMPETVEEFTALFDAQPEKKVSGWWEEFEL